MSELQERESFAEEILDELVPEGVDWQKLVVRYPIRRCWSPPPAVSSSAAGMGRRSSCAVEFRGGGGLARRRSAPLQGRRIRESDEPAFPPPHLRRPLRTPAPAAVSEGVLAFVERNRPDLVVVSGDLTQRAKPEQFRQARAFVDGIEALGCRR